MKRGEIYYANLSPAVGSEMDKRRPVLVVSNDANNRAADTVKISNTSYQALTELSASSGKPIQTILEQAIEQYRRQEFLVAANLDRISY